MIISLTEEATFRALSDSEQGEGSKFRISEIRNRLIMQGTKVLRGGTTAKIGRRASGAVTESPSRRGAERSDTVDMSMLLQGQENPFRTEIERSRLMNGVRTIIGSQKTLKVVTKKFEIGT
jgi:hypothetical protein